MRTGSFIISSALSSAADTLVSTLLSAAGVAVNSMMHDGLNRASVSNDRSVRALCASSTITTGR